MFRSRVRALGALMVVGLVGALMAPAHAAGTQNIFHAWAVDVTDPGCEFYNEGDVAVAKGDTYFTTNCYENESYTTVLTKVDASGKTVWSKRIGQSGHMPQPITAGDFGVVVSQHLWDHTRNAEFGRITRYGPGGAQLWQTDLPRTINDVLVVNGQLFAGGTTYSRSPVTGPSYVARLDLATGAVQAEKTYSVAGFGYGGAEVVRMAELRGTLVLAVHTSTAPTADVPSKPISLVRRIGPGLAVWWTKQSSNPRILDLDASDDQIFTTRPDDYRIRSGGLETLNPDGSTVREVPGEALGAKVVATPGGPVTISNQYVTSYNLDGTQRWQLRTTYDKGDLKIWGADSNYQGIRFLDYDGVAPDARNRLKLLKITKNDACPC